MEFFRLGRDNGKGAPLFQERAMFGGNRCITPWTVVPTDRGERQVLEVFGEESFGVLTWADGSLRSTKAEAAFLKCIEPAFRVHLDNGEVFECSGKHQVLTCEASPAHPRGTWRSLAHLVQRADVLHWSRIQLGFEASCGTDSYRRDPLPRLVADSVLVQLPLPGGAPSTGRYGSQPDASASTPERSRVYRAFDRRAIREIAPRVAGLSGTSEWECPVGSPSALPRFPVDRYGDRFPGERALRVAEWQSGVLQQLRHFEHVYLPTCPLPLVGGNSIVAVAAIGLQPIVDFTVPGTHCYVAAGAVHHNTGKTVTGTFEDVLHLTGNYPSWWEGYRFKRPVEWWAATDTAKNTRDILQSVYCGKPGDAQAQGTGMIPGDLILRTTVKHGLSDAFETIFVRHVPTGGVSTLQLKSYDQGRVAFQGTANDGIHLDEEPDLEIYAECILRLMTRNGLLILTETPLLGVTKLMLAFMPHLSPVPLEEQTGG